jgi:hypothetical protein
MDRPNRSIMVLAVHTLGGPRLGNMLLDLAAEQPTSFHFVVPSTIPEYGWTWTEAQVERDARRRLAVHLEFSRTLGLDVDGEIAPAEPEELVRRDAVIVAVSLRSRSGRSCRGR